MHHLLLHCFKLCLVNVAYLRLPAMHPGIQPAIGTTRSIVVFNARCATLERRQFQCICRGSGCMFFPHVPFIFAYMKVDRSLLTSAHVFTIVGCPCAVKLHGCASTPALVPHLHTALLHCEQDVVDFVSVVCLHPQYVTLFCNTVCRMWWTSYPRSLTWA